MHMLESDARRLAVALLAGKFEKEAVLQRTIPLVSGSTIWLKRLVNQLITRFGEQRPRLRELVTFLMHSRSLANASEKEDFGIQAYGESAEFLPSPGLFENVGVLQLRSVGEIGDWLELDENELLWVHRPRRRLPKSVPFASTVALRDLPDPRARTTQVDVAAIATLG